MKTPRNVWQIGLLAALVGACATSADDKPKPMGHGPAGEVAPNAAASGNKNASVTASGEAVTFFDAEERDTAEDRLSRLQQVLAKSPDKEPLVADIKVVLEAEIADQAQDFETSLAKWRKALELAKGSLGKRALRGWTLAYYQLMDKNQTPESVADVLIKDLQSVSSSYLVEANINKSASLAQRIRDILQNQNPNEYVMAAGATFTPPADGLFLPNDPTLEVSAKIFCQDQNPDMIAIDNWLSRFPDGVRGYWDALIFKCRLQTGEALRQLREVLPQLVQTESIQSLGVRGIELEIEWLREQGERKLMIESYSRLVEAYYQPGVMASGLGIEPFALRLRRIDAVLSAARYKTLVADYKQAQTYVNQALKDLDLSREQDQALTGFSTAKLDNLKADALHTIAFRIFVEQGNYKEAIRVTEDGLALPELSVEWRERLGWNLGMYWYLAGDMTKAILSWEGMLAQPLNESNRATVLYWVARSYANQKNDAKAKEYEQKLIKEQPFGFYSVLIQEQNNAASWRQFFASYDQNVKQLNDGKKIDEKGMLADPLLGKDWARVLVLLDANLKEFYQPALEQAGRNMRNQRKLDKQTLPIYLYYTRLAARAGRYFEAVQTTGQIAVAFPDVWQTYPEQLEVIYPRKFPESIDKFAVPLGVRPETVLAVMRQESTFNTEVKSGAGAIGLMQVMPATAEKIARSRSYIYEDVHRSLLRSDFNIAVGSAYLDDLQKHYPDKPAAVFAAYNAGEPAVDSWLQHRGDKDMLVWAELIPFGETRQYVKNVWRNQIIYFNILKSLAKTGS